MLNSNLSQLLTLLVFILSFPPHTVASLCETCSSTAEESLCHQTTQCFGVSSASGATVKYCACSPGFRAFGIAADDTTQQFRLASPEGIVFVKPGVACNQLCDAWTLGSDGCKEVPVSTQCVDAGADNDNSNEHTPSSTLKLSATASVTAVRSTSATAASTYLSSMSYSSYSGVIPSPTRGGVLSNPTQSAAATVTAFALGGLPFVQNTSFYASIAPVSWESVVTSDNPGPQDILFLPGGSNATYYVSNSSSSYAAPLNGTTNFVPTTINPKLQSRAIPSSVDWRERWGVKWLTTVQSQGNCGSCWSFATTALAETMVRIQFGAWSKRSEGDLRDSWGISCDTGNWPHLAAAWASAGGNGISDEVCVPYQATDTNYFPCADRSGRSLKLPEAYTFQPGTDIQEQKKWISEIGPLTCAFEVKEDFDSWTPSKGVYRWDKVSKSRGWHAVLIVGYDDVRGCWIIRNSWGKYAGDDGYFYIAYGEVSIDKQPKTGITNVNPDPWSRRRLHNGNMIQSSAGYTHRDFQLVRRGGSGGIMHIARNGGNTGVSKSDYSWYIKGRLLYKDPYGRVHGDKVMGQPTMLESSFNRNYEILYWEDTGYLNHWYYNQNTDKWFCTGIQGDGLMAGYPGFVQTSDSAFAIVVRRIDGSLWHFTRDPANADHLIIEYSIASGVLQSGPALVEANIGKGSNNLYVVAVLTTGKMQMFWRDTAADTAWQAGEVFGSGIGDTPPVMIQSHFWTENENNAGAFQLAVVVNGKIQHWQRVNKDLEEGGTPAVGVQGKWGLVATFGDGVKHVWSLVHGSFNHALELVAEYDNGYMIHWRYTNSGWQPAAVVPGEK